jgi:hypothetical protein
MASIGVSNYRALLDGDDVLVIIEESDYSKFESAKPWYLKRGFRMKVENPVNILERIDFCKSRPVWTPQGYLMVRNVRISMEKDCLARRDLNSRKLFERWAAAVGMGGISLCGGIPIMQSYYQSFVRNSSGAKPLDNDPTMKDYLHKVSNMSRRFMTVDYRTRASFFMAFDICPEEQMAVERYYDDVNIEFGKHVLDEPAPFFLG